MIRLSFLMILFTAGLLLPPDYSRAEEARKKEATLSKQDREVIQMLELLELMELLKDMDVVASLEDEQ